MQHCGAGCCSVPWGLAGCRQLRGIPGTGTYPTGEHYQRSGSRAHHTQYRSLRAFFLLFSNFLFIYYYLFAVCGYSPLWAVCTWCMRWGFSSFSIPLSPRALPGSVSPPLFASQMLLTPCGGRRRQRMQRRGAASPARPADAYVWRYACVCNLFSPALFLSDGTGQAPLRTAIPLTSCTGIGLPEPAKAAGSRITGGERCPGPRSPPGRASEPGREPVGGSGTILPHTSQRRG